VTIST
jgi:GNAT superfamily N-acetyltransferase